MPKPGRATAPGFLLRHARAHPQQEQQQMPFQVSATALKYPLNQGMKNHCKFSCCLQ
jgi:hypothetical protein